MSEPAPDSATPASPSVRRDWARVALLLIGPPVVAAILLEAPHDPPDVFPDKRLFAMEVVSLITGPFALAGFRSAALRRLPRWVSVLLGAGLGYGCFCGVLILIAMAMAMFRRT